MKNSKREQAQHLLSEEAADTFTVISLLRGTSCIQLSVTAL